MLKADQRFGQSVGPSKTLVDGNGRLLREKSEGCKFSLTSFSQAPAVYKGFAVDAHIGPPSLTWT